MDGRRWLRRGRLLRLLFGRRAASDGVIAIVAVIDVDVVVVVFDDFVVIVVIVVIVDDFIVIVDDFVIIVVVDDVSRANELSGCGYITRPGQRYLKSLWILKSLQILAQDFTCKRVQKLINCVRITNDFII